MDRKNKVIILGIMTISVILLYWSINTSIKSGKEGTKDSAQSTGRVVSDIPEHSEETFKKAQETETEDPCATPEGYTDDAWRQHMSHHPDIYKECL